ncbi:MAG: hypothetical protein EBR10_09605 [Planctomycetes bacterium]|nr:hypothetical protein [Planctomycetota bacterium]
MIHTLQLLVAAFTQLQTPDPAATPPAAAMLRYPDISGDRIVFAYANGLWTVDRNGGTAQPVADPPGPEAFPRFSPDGKSIAFLGNYEGNRDIYVTPITGGIPSRVTHHPTTELPTDWMSDGRILFSASGMGTYPRAPQIFAVNAAGGLPDEFPVPYGANPTVSADGRYLAYTPHSTDTRTWKRYRGGMATDIWVYDLKENTAQRVTQWEGTDTLPMWHGSTLYYLSDAGPEHRLNIWSCDARGGNRRQITNFSDFDVKWPSVGPDDGSGGEIVFQQGSDLQVLDLASRKVRVVPVQVPGARARLRPQIVEAGNFIDAWDISPSGKRAVVTARGDIWTLPAENGIPRNLTGTNGVFEREPTWSPDGKWIAFCGDNAEGGYDLFALAADGSGDQKQLTKDGVFKGDLNWSPDSKWIAYAGANNSLYLVDFASGESKVVMREAWNDNPPSPRWSHDSSWIAFAHSDPSGRSNLISLFDVETGETRAISAPMFPAGTPTFDRAGEWLYFPSDQEFAARYGSLDTTWIYDNSEVLLAVPLRADVKAAWQVLETDEEKPEEPKKAADKKDGGKKGADQDSAVAPTPAGAWKCSAKTADDAVEFTLVITVTDGDKVTATFSSERLSGDLAGSWDAANKSLRLEGSKDGARYLLELTIDGDSVKGSASVTTDEGEKKYEITGSKSTDDTKPTEKPAEAPKSADESKPTDEKSDDPKSKRKGFKVDFDGIVERTVRVPSVARGAFGTLAVNDKGHLIFVRRNENGGIKIIDAREKKPSEKAVTGGGSFTITPSGKQILVPEGGGARIVDASAGGASKTVVNRPMRVEVDPRAEWRQMVRDAWLIFRDFFYDPNMHRVDWKKVLDNYLALVDDANSREDVSFIISEMISELNVGHAYYQGGESESGPSSNTGMLGVDYALGTGTRPDGSEAKAYRIARLFEGAPWDTDARNPLRAPDVKVKVGDYILEVNGTPVDTSKSPWAAFAGLGDRTTSLLVSDKPYKDPSARTVVVRLLDSEADLRYRSWVECNRAYVESRSGGRVGYVYVPNTGVDGQTELVRQLLGQRGRDALIVDDRWNGGGQIPTRFIELLDRPVTNWWARRDVNGQAWPPDGHFGPKVMLINGLAGSGGDMFPWLFRQSKLGPLVGSRTWGGLVGISGNPSLIDGAGIRVPKFAFYESDGTWGVEGHGVDPDFPVTDDAGLMRGGPSRGGVDPQMDKAIELMEQALRDRPHKQVPIPPYPDRSGMGLPTSDR